MPLLIGDKAIVGYRSDKPGVGDYFHRRASKLEKWLAVSNCCCDPLRRLMNTMGPDWCQANAKMLVREIAKNVTVSGVPGVKTAIMIALLCSIRDARHASRCRVV